MLAATGPAVPDRPARAPSVRARRIRRVAAAPPPGWGAVPPPSKSTIASAFRGRQMSFATTSFQFVHRLSVADTPRGGPASARDELGVDPLVQLCAPLPREAVRALEPACRQGGAVR